MPTKYVKGHKGVVGLLVGMIVGGSLAFAGVTFAASSLPSTINTCTSVNHHGVYGKTKVTTGSSCPHSGTYQTWSQAPPIVAGFNRSDVDLAANGNDTTVGILTISTAGSYAVSATLSLANVASSADIDECQLGGDFGTTVVSAESWSSMTLTSVNTFSAGGTITLTCEDGNARGSQSASGINMIAIPGTGVSNGPLPS